MQDVSQADIEISRVEAENPYASITSPAALFPSYPSYLLSANSPSSSSSDISLRGHRLAQLQQLHDMSERLPPLNPKPYLQELLQKTVIVRLKWGQEYKGTLQSTDKYMNLQLLDTVEFVDGKNNGTLGEVLIRCNNVLWITEDGQGKLEDTTMEE